MWRIPIAPQRRLSVPYLKTGSVPLNVSEQIKAGPTDKEITR